MKNKLSYITLIVITLFALLWGGGISRSTIAKKESLANWDGYGYYLHLPSLIIYKDYQQYEKVHATAHDYHIATGYQTLPLNDSVQLPVYPIGQAVTWFPFFGCAHAVAQNTNYPANGFSPPYQWALFLSSICFIFLGFYFSRKLLLHFFSDGITSFAMLLIFFGTNYFYYSLYEISMPHVYLYAYLAMMLYSAHQYHQTKKNKYLWYTALAFGMGVLTRNSEVFWIIILALWGIPLKDIFSLNSIKTISRRTVFYLTFAAVLYFTFQMSYYRLSTQQWYVDGYAGHTFNLLHPNVVNCLFGFYKGWFIYTPLAMLFILGIVILYFKKQEWFLSFLTFIILYIYLLISWDDWTYGSTFGFRPIVQTYALFIIPLAFCLQALIKRFKFISLVALASFILINLIQTHQFAKGILLREPYGLAYYKKVFLKLKQNRHDRIVIDVPTHQEGKISNVGNVLFEQKDIIIPPVNESKVDTIYALKATDNIRLQTKIIYSYYGDSYNAWNQPRLITYTTPASNQSYWAGLRLPEIMNQKSRDTIVFNQSIHSKQGDSIRFVLEHQVPDSLVIHKISISAL